MKKESIEKDLDKIVSISKEFGAIKVLLFGSCLDNINSAHDIDIAVSGIRPRDFFRYYGKVSMEVDDEVDIVDLDDVRKHLHKRFYLKEGFYMKDEYKDDIEKALSDFWTEL